MEVFIGNDTFVLIKKLSGGGFGQSYVYENIETSVKYVIKLFIPYNEKCSYESFKVEYNNLLTISKILNDDIGVSCHRYIQCLINMVYIPLGDPNYEYFFNDLQQLVAESRTKNKCVKTSLYGIMTLYVNGPDLKIYTKRENNLNLDIYKFLNQMTRVLDYLHSKEIVHRDIKPTNIIYNKDKDCFTLIDFGIACQSVCTFFFGTEYFIPKNISYKLKNKLPIYLHDYLISDIFALGVTAYLLVNKHHPYLYTFKDILNNNPYYRSNSGDPKIDKMLDELILNPQNFLYPNNLTKVWNKIKNEY